MGRGGLYVPNLFQFCVVIGLYEQNKVLLRQNFQQPSKMCKSAKNAAWIVVAA